MLIVCELINTERINNTCIFILCSQKSACMAQTALYHASARTKHTVTTEMGAAHARLDGSENTAKPPALTDSMARGVTLPVDARMGAPVTL